MIEPAAGDVVLSRELRSGGYGRSEIARLERQGSLTHLRRGRGPPRHRLIAQRSIGS